jgi:hypothetical protein
MQFHSRWWRADKHNKKGVANMQMGYWNHPNRRWCLAIHYSRRQAARSDASTQGFWGQFHPLHEASFQESRQPITGDEASCLDYGASSQIALPPLEQLSSWNVPFKLMCDLGGPLNFTGFDLNRSVRRNRKCHHSAMSSDKFYGPKQPRASRIPNEIWDRHRDFIIENYLQEGLAGVVRKIEALDIPDFCPTYAPALSVLRICAD